MSLVEARQAYDESQYEAAVQTFLGVGRTTEPIGDLELICDHGARRYPVDLFTTRDEPMEQLSPEDLLREAFALKMLGHADAAENVGWSALNAELKKEKRRKKTTTLSRTAQKIRMHLIACGCDGFNKVDPRIWEIRNIRDQIRSGVENADFKVQAPFGNIEK